MSQQTALAELLLEFLEAGIHEFIYGWQIYPKELFELCQKYDVPVHACRHPLLSAYIETMLQSCKPWILDGRVDKISIAVLAATGQLLDTCVFEVGVNVNWRAEIPVTSLEEAFRRSLVQISSAPSLVVAPAGDPFTKSFRLYLDTLEASGSPETLVPANGTENSWVTTHDEAAPMEGSLFPIASTVPTLPLRLNVYVIHAPPFSLQARRDQPTETP
ncbi:hypothetical protein ACHHYP_08937 [Achlya hypogyna]|uniref:HORMA domain-containing protein n=1 Tax=Achlya hypogyna TaxID=1202772 RepID=A0A1V9ZJZ1_ACHHY|nr:hypothetical protein ACHHYP_08937 [Achlya hypogyna]